MASIPPKKHRLKIGKQVFTFKNWYEFFYLYFEIFLLKEYFFVSRKKVPVVIDCGAHIGMFILFVQKIYPKAHIIAFEPLPKNIELLEENSKQNSIKSIVVIPAGVYNRIGKKAIFTSAEQKPSWGSSFESSAGETVKKELVSIVKLSNFLDREIDFIKMDIEGAEEIVLREIEPKVSRVREFVIEIHNKSDTNTSILSFTKDYFQKHGFAYEYKKPFRIAIGEKIDRFLGRKSTDIYMFHAWK